MGGTRYVDEGPSVSAKALYVEPREERLIGERSSDEGPYRIVRRVGSGGMGSVFLAYHRERTGVNELVAIKRLHPHLLDDAEYVDMFFDEAAIASRIRHPNVARVFDYGMLAGAPYLAMELLRGKALALVRRSLQAEGCPITRDERFAFVGRVITDAAAGLHAAHELLDERGEMLNVVHRDVSPQNIFVTFDGTSKIVDFGTVKAKLQHHRTRTGFFKGKCAYMAPDILIGKQVDRRMDVWGLGVVLWELLTGKRLFAGQNDVQTLRAVLEREVPHPCDVASGVPEPMADVAMHALQRDPDKRYPSARLLGAELEEASSMFTRVTSTAVSGWLDLLFPGERERGEAECARLASGDHVEEETRLWLEVDDEDTPVGSEEPTSDSAWAAGLALPPPRSSRSAGLRSRASQPQHRAGPLETTRRDRLGAGRNELPPIGGDGPGHDTPALAPATLPSPDPMRSDEAAASLQRWKLTSLALVGALAGVILGRWVPAEQATSNPTPPPALAPAVFTEAAVPTTFELWEVGANGRRLIWRTAHTPAALSGARSPSDLSVAEPLPPLEQPRGFETTDAEPPTPVAAPLTTGSAGMTAPARLLPSYSRE
jgi:serine/threonine protein kinase